jgi:hypothetical protein
MKKWLFVGIWLTGFSIGLATAQSREGYTPGETVAPFSLKTGTGRVVSLADYADKSGVVVIFQSSTCPFSNAYDDRIATIDRQFSPKGWPVLTVQVNEAEPALIQVFGATRSPQVFVLRRSGTAFVLAYTGAIDDNPQDAGSVQHRYLETALTELVAGRAVSQPLTRPVGCVIRPKSAGSVR